MQNIDNIIVPDKWDWVDFSNNYFRIAFNKCIESSNNIFLQARAGSGKSLLIKLISSLKKNVVVLSTTGSTAVELSSDQIAAKTIHSFLSIPPVPIFSQDHLHQIGYNNQKILELAEIIIIDEVSMMSAALFDFICQKIVYHRKDSEIPRLILFGDIMQLPPVIGNDRIIQDYFNKEYNGNVMFFNSNFFKAMDFEILYLRKSYRQADEIFAEKLLEISAKDHTQETLDFFNQRVMSLPKYEQLYSQYIYTAPTNNVVNKINDDYIKKLNTESKLYKAKMSNKFPKDKLPNSEEVLIKVGAQVMCLVNHYGDSDNLKNIYANGTTGIVTALDDDYVKIEKTDGSSAKVQRTRSYLYEMKIGNNNTIEYIPTEWFEQIDCKIARASTVHKVQGKSLDQIYVALGGWVPPGISYVALSRVTSLEGLGMARPLKNSDINVNKEAYHFLFEPED